eukprot:GHVQ01014985.1.p1 GENE.GHVQ01014985.1~~GHVQ01014985.1.p1  ORF type:complete len:113 (+),score=9.23 GHVQ01014985.1:172-510(+)
MLPSSSHTLSVRSLRTSNSSVRAAVLPLDSMSGNSFLACSSRTLPSLTRATNTRNAHTHIKIYRSRGNTTRLHQTQQRNNATIANSNRTTVAATSRTTPSPTGSLTTSCTAM